ncbi:fasciclin domain-containing protein [Noviherbaspirillum humi]|nr:fasciclin domain-containing protein [Noviherbaspirillum humi]
MTSVSAADLVDTAARSSEIKTFTAAVKDAGVAEALKQGGPYTVFAPSNTAFDKLPNETRDSLFKDKAKLAQVINHHVIKGKVLVTEVKPGKVESLDGKPVNLKSDNGKVTVDDANVTQSDINADNGVIHIVDTVVLPKPE